MYGGDMHLTVWISAHFLLLPPSSGNYQQPAEMIHTHIHTYVTCAYSRSSLNVMLKPNSNWNPRSN